MAGNDSVPFELSYLFTTFNKNLWNIYFGKPRNIEISESRTKSYSIVVAFKYGSQIL